MTLKLAAGQPKDPMEEVDDRMLLLRAVSELPSVYRETILLYYYNGFSAKEIAQIQHCAQPTVNVRLKRGRELLRQAVSEDGKEG